jgi:hypothetical protein
MCHWRIADLFQLAGGDFFLDAKSHFPINRIELADTRGAMHHCDMKQNVFVEHI